VTVELVEETDEVLAARLAELWETAENNHHHTDEFRHWSRKLGVVLDNDKRACRRPKK
jgi:hypothetical protein